MKKLVFLLFLILSIQGLFAQKVLTAYSGFTATDIKNRASVPLQANIAVNGASVECRNITTTNIKTVLNETVTGIGALCQSANVNTWSNFGPTEWYIDATVLKNRVKTPYQFGSFAGYNNNAIAPGFMGSSHITSFKYIQNDANPYTISVGLQGGEINFPAMVNATHAKLVVRYQGTIVGSNLIALGSSYNSTVPINPYCTVSMGSWTGNKEFTASVYLSNVNADDLCLFPNVPEWTITAIQRLNPSGAVLPSGTVIKIVAGSATLDLAGNYTISITNITRFSMTPYTGRINIVANLYDDTNTLIHTQQITTNDNNRSYTGFLSHAAGYDYHVEFVISNADA